MSRSEINSPLDIEKISHRTRGVFRNHGIKKAILFGSFAVGRQSRKSDIDLILIKPTVETYFERFKGILSDLYRTLPGRDIEVFIYTPEELAGIAHRKFIQRALEEGKVIYESR
jgi:predicted nucleotidyltransferase